MPGFAILALFLACLGRFGPPSPWISLLSLAVPVSGLLALIGFAWTCRRPGRRWAGGGAIFSLAVLLSCLAPFAGSDFGRVTNSVGERQVRLVEFNAWTRNRAPGQAARWILAQRPDVVVLLEAAGQADAIAASLSPYLPYRTSCRGNRRCSTTILSRVAPVERLGLAHGDADNRRALSAALVRFDRPVAYTLVAAHLSRPLPFGRQDWEVTALMRAVGGRHDDRLIVTGDFNAPGWSSTVRRIASSLSVRPLLAWPSWPAQGAIPPLLDLDHIFVGKGWRAARVERGPVLGSDHRPFLVELMPAP